MAEAEAVLLDAAERVSAATRALWARGGGPAGPPQLALAAVRAGLQVLVHACFGIDPPLVPCDPPPAPGRLARGLGRLAPWQRHPEAVACSDGTRILLPRALPLGEGGEPEARALLRVTALGLADRIRRGAVAACPCEPLARDLYWIADGAAGERRLAMELPGLVPALARARAAALAARPPLRALGPAERHVEELARGLLAGTRAIPEPACDPWALASWAQAYARRLAALGPYRGLAPVAHWGVPRPDLVARAQRTSARDPSPLEGEATARARSRRLERRIEARDAEPEDETDAAPPILLASEDGHLALQDPAGLRRPCDRGLDDPLDLDALAEELARQPELARVREPGAVGEILCDDDEAARPGEAERAAEREPAVGLLYPEWDHRLCAYRPGHCIVREAPAPAGDPGWPHAVRARHAALFARVRRLFEALRPERERERRRPDGAELDLDAFVTDHADRRAGRPPSDRIYTELRPNRRDVAVSFLVDASGSTDTRLEGDRSVLDVARTATLLLADALRALGDRHAIHAFSGEGRRDVRVARVKGFAEPPGVAARRIAGLVPDRYTRLGAPLRHLTAALAREPARRRLLLLLSDGKPNDEDAYEGRYGVEDTRQAVVEARALGIDVFCLTIDRDGSSYLPRMFGPAGYAILPRIEQLPERLVELYRRLTAASA